MSGIDWCVQITIGTTKTTLPAYDREDAMRRAHRANNTLIASLATRPVPPSDDVPVSWAVPRPAQEAGWTWASDTDVHAAWRNW